MLRRGNNDIPVTAARGTLFRLKGSTLEMLIWFILHEQVRVNLRLLRLFPINHARPVYTVEEILQGNTEELRTLQRFIFKHYGSGQDVKRRRPSRLPKEAERKALSSHNGKGIKITVQATANNNEATASSKIGSKHGELANRTSVAAELSRGEANGNELAALCATGDDCESPYEPANAVRKALTIVFSRVESRVRAAAGNGYDKRALRQNGGKNDEKSVDQMKQMITLMFDPPNVTRGRFDGDESFVDLKFKKCSERMAETQCLVDDDVVQEKFVEERLLHSKDESDDASDTLKAYYGMAGSLTKATCAESSQQMKRKENFAYDITPEEWKSLEQIFRNESSGKSCSYCFDIEFSQDSRHRIHDPAKMLDPLCSSYQHKVELMFTNLKNRAKCFSGWNYSTITFGSGAAALVIFIVCRCI
ncbi:uncharacterized protein [Montipora capricornis]|uniref:uncharacterized protein n=1 Tax=Montipora capricornis TaxID=246305 RepID=UPI0035F11908